MFSRGFFFHAEFNGGVEFQFQGICEVLQEFKFDFVNSTKEAAESHICFS